MSIHFSGTLHVPVYFVSIKLHKRPFIAQLLAKLYGHTPTTSDQ